LAFAAMLYSGAYSVVTSISVIGFYLSYIAPVYLGLRNKGAWMNKRGPWHLGGASNTVNILAVAWTVLISTIMIMPPNARAGWGILSVMTVLFLLHVAGGKHKMYKPNWEFSKSSNVNVK
jgi:hypothetical protein